MYLATYASAATRRQANLGVPVPRSRPWRELYQISTNWRNGSARATTLGTELRKAVLPPAPATTDVVDGGALPQSTTSSEFASDPAAAADDTLLQFHQQYIFSASRSPAGLGPDPLCPVVTVHQTLPSGGSAVVGTFGSDRLRQFHRDRPAFRPMLSLSEMRLDSHGGGHPLLMALFYSTGQYALFRLDLPASVPARPSFSATEVYTSLTTDLAPRYHDPSLLLPDTLSSRPPRPFDPVSTARLHWPLLVTLTESLTLRFLRLSGPRDSGPIEVDETETPLQSRERWDRVVLSVVPASTAGSSKGGEHFSVSLAYSTPVFPSSWTVGLQQFHVAVWPRRPLVIRAQHATALPAHTPLPTTPRRTALLGASEASSPVRAAGPPPRRGPSPVTSIEHSHPFIVTSRVDNTIDVYEVTRSASWSSPVAPSQESLQVVHRRTLFGHTARVSSVALLPSTSDRDRERDGGADPHVGEADVSALDSIRCVSAGDDGAVKVWQLSPSAGASSPLPRRKRTAADADLQVRIRDDDDGGGGGDDDLSARVSDWQHLKRRRATATGAGSPSAMGPEPERPLHVRRLWVAEDKIVLLQRGAGAGLAAGHEETLQVLRFD